MNNVRWRRKLTAASLVLALSAMTGCQTWFPQAGLTLPSGDYLKHPPQYFPLSPPFPLPREEARMEQIYAIPPGPAVGAGPPPAVAPIPGGGAFGP
jgi:hypothetical protein